MGVFNIFKKGVSVSKNDIAKREDIAEHLNRLLKNGTTLYFKSGNYGKSVPIVLKKIGEMRERIAFKAISVFPEKEGAKITVEYETMGNRYKFDTKVISYNESTGIIISTFPSIVRDNERRREKRVSIPNRARFLVKVISGVGGGIGFSGDIINLTTLGLGMYVERVIDIRSERELQIKEKLFTEGMELSVIRFKAEGSREAEVSGKLIYAIKDGARIRVGIEFKKPSESSLGIIKSMLMKFSGR